MSRLLDYIRQSKAKNSPESIFLAQVRRRNDEAVRLLANKRRRAYHYVQSQRRRQFQAQQIRPVPITFGQVTPQNIRDYLFSTPNI